MNCTLWRVVLSELATPSGLAVAVGSFALVFYARQASAQFRDHVASLYRLAFEKMDDPEIRKGRNYVYHEMEENAFEKEHWQELESFRSNPDYQTWSRHKAWAEVVARSFDQLALMVREGVMPLNILSRFYASPAVRCWLKLHSYIKTERLKRTQNGHLWEWENMVFDTIIPLAKKNKGIWRGVYDHDNLQKWFNEIGTQMKDNPMPRDEGYSPRCNFWVIRPWYRFWEWGRSW
jgi:hypothetical protein